MNVLPKRRYFGIGKCFCLILLFSSARLRQTRDGRLATRPGWHSRSHGPWSPSSSPASSSSDGGTSGQTARIEGNRRWRRWRRRRFIQRARLAVRTAGECSRRLFPSQHTVAWQGFAGWTDRRYVENEVGGNKDALNITTERRTAQWRWPKENNCRYCLEFWNLLHFH